MSWSDEGMRTLPSVGATAIAGDDASGYVRCVASHLLPTATEYAGLWSVVAVSPPASPPQVSVVVALEVRPLPIETNPVFIAVMAILCLDVVRLLLQLFVSLLNEGELRAQGITLLRKGVH